VLKEIFPLTICDNVLYLMFPSALRCQDFIFSSSDIFYAFAPDVDACTYIFHFGILTLEKTLCFIPNSWFNLLNKTSSSFINIFRKFAQEWMGPCHSFSNIYLLFAPCPNKKKTFKTAIICLMAPTTFGTPWP